jgi:predicted PurR-regulated permease PerM
MRRGGGMNTVLLVVIVVVLIAIAAYLIPLLIEMKRTVVSFRKTPEENLNPTLEQLCLALKSVRPITDNVGVVTEDLKQLSHSVGEMGKTVGAVNMLIENVGASSAVRVISLKVGIMVALEFLIANLLKKGERK